MPDQPPDPLVFPPLRPGESAEAGGWSLLRGGDIVTAVGPDGTTLQIALTAAAQAGLARRILVLGGTRSGKSSYAEKRLALAPSVTYLATAFPRPDDPEWLARVSAHRARRPESWRTVETADVAGELRAAKTPVLIDCISLWLAGALDDPALDARADELVDAWTAAPTQVVAVSSEVGLGVVPPTESGRRYRDALGILNARLAATADEVWLVTAGLPRRLR